MKKSNYFLLTAAAVLVFAVLASGGCGGNSSSRSSKVADSGLYLPTMFDIRITPEFNAMIDELKAEGVWDKVESLTFYNVNEYLTPEQFAEALEEIPEEARNDFILQNFLNDLEFVSYYEQGGILTLFHPEKGQLDNTFSFLKSVSADISGIDISTDIEICAITKRTLSGLVVSKDNTLQLDNVFVYVVPDISTLVSVDEDYSPDDIEKEYIDMQVERWRRYYYWLASIENRAQENMRAVSAIKSSAAENNNVVDISRVITGNYDWSFSNSKNWDKVTTNPSSRYIDSTSQYIKYAGTRSNVLEYSVYSVHSFTDHCDYFVVNSNLSTKPGKVETEAKCYFRFFYPNGYTWFRGLRGYTCGLDSKISLGECVYTSMLDGVKQGTKYSENFTWSKDGLFAGHDFGWFDGVHFTKNISFDATNITVVNSSDKSSAVISAVFDKPTADSSSSWSGFAANSASSNELTLPVVAVLKVEQEEWQKGYESMDLVFSGAVHEGEVVRDYYVRDNYKDLFKTPRLDAAFTKNFSFSVKNPNPPKHSTTHQRYYAANKHGGVFGVQVLSESEWEIELEQGAESWITFDKTSGQATGPEGTWVIFRVPENTSGSGRHANMYLVTYPYNDKTKRELTLFEMFESNNEGYSAE